MYVFMSNLRVVVAIMSFGSGVCHLLVRFHVLLCGVAGVVIGWRFSGPAKFMHACVTAGSLAGVRACDHVRLGGLTVPLIGFELAA